ncbi:MAG: hypothetical protein ACF8SC_05590 [Phycisphaerales bacterium JB037]
MNSDTRRKIIVQCVAGCAVSALAWLILAEPLRRQHAESQAALVSQERELGAFERGENRTIENPVAELSRLIARAERLERALATNADEERTYRRFGQLASRIGVRIDRLDPLRSPGGSRGDTEFVQVIGYRANIVGTYAQIAEFIEAIERSGPGTRVETCRIRPEPTERENDLIAAVIETSHLSLAKPLIELDSRGGDS